MSSSPYTHGSSEAEQARLTALNGRLNQRCIEAARLVAGERVIDFGAGLGQYSRMMARATGVPVLGIERSAEQIAEAVRQAAADNEADILEMRQGDVLDPPFRDDEMGQFDVARARFVLEQFPPRCRWYATWRVRCGREDASSSPTTTTTDCDCGRNRRGSRRSGTRTSALMTGTETTRLSDVAS